MGRCDWGSGTVDLRVSGYPDPDHKNLWDFLGQEVERQDLPVLGVFQGYAKGAGSSTAMFKLGVPAYCALSNAHQTVCCGVQMTKNVFAYCHEWIKTSSTPCPVVLLEDFLCCVDSLALQAFCWIPSSCLLRRKSPQQQR